MRYLVTARVRTGRRAALARAIDRGTLGAGSVAGDEYLHDMANARELPNGQVKWQLATADKIHAAPAVAKNGIVLIGSQDDHLYAVDEDGVLLWYLELGGDVDATPAIASDGTIYVAGDDGVLRAFE